MKLTLIKPNMGRSEDGPYVDDGRMEPLQLGVLAALSPAEVEVVLYDDRLEAIPYDEQTDLVAITMETFTARRSYEIAAEYRARGVPVVIGGMHASLLPEEAAAHADAVCVGDAETVWGWLLEDARRGRLQKFYRAEPGPAHPGLLTRRDIFHGKGYLPITLLQFSRGCRFACSYCATSRYFKQTQHFRPVEEVVREIAAQPRKLLFFVDDNIVADPAAAKALFRALIPLKIRWVSQASLEMTRDPELMDLMARSGCLGNVVGFESLEPASLAAMNKAPNLESTQGYRRELEVLRDYGLQTWAAFTLGHDGDGRDTVARTLDFARRSRFAFAAFNLLMPYPGTPLYRQLEAEGRLLFAGRWWLHPDYRFNHAAFRPRLLSAEELTDACFAARSAFNSLGSILQRAIDFHTHLRSPLRLGLYFAYNPLFRREVFKKQGLRLGYR